MDPIARATMDAGVSQPFSGPSAKYATIMKKCEPEAMACATTVRLTDVACRAAQPMEPRRYGWAYQSLSGKVATMS